MRAWEWLNEMKVYLMDTHVTTQDVDRERLKFIRNEKFIPAWTAQEGPLCIPSSSFNMISNTQATGTLMDFLSWESG